MRFEIHEVHVVDVPEDEMEETIAETVSEIRDNAHWYTEMFGREAWCEEVVPLGVSGNGAA